MDRREFFRVAGKAGTGIALASLPLVSGCKGGDPSGPEPLDPVPVNLEFKVYNHTQGLRASFTKNQMMSGTKLTLNIADILGQYAITGVDTRRISLREDNSGKLIEYSKVGLVNLTIPRNDTTFNIFLFNSGPNDLYQWFENQPATGWDSTFRQSLIKVYRQDFDGQTGQEKVWGGEPVPEIGGNPGVFDQMNQALKPDWAPFRYGYFERGTSGILGYGFGNSLGDLFLNNQTNTTINAQRVQTIPEQIGIGLGAIIQRIMGWYDLSNSDASSKIQTNGVLHQAGKDVLAFMHVRGPKAINV